MRWVIRGKGSEGPNAQLNLSLLQLSWALGPSDP